MNKDTKIKYLLAAGKLYEVKDISFFKMLITAVETDKLVEDVSPEEVFDLMVFKNYKVTLINGCKKEKIVNFTNWKQNNGNKIKVSKCESFL